jgi:serine/threonine-protein kinase
MGFVIGENVGPYRIVTQLGSGGMATVYKAYHAALDRYVAIKVMHAAFKEDHSFLARFQREARIVARLEHPHIVPVYDFNEHDGQPYLVMRFIEGETLKARLQAGRLTIPQAVDILRPVCQALAYAHEQGVLHRDIKPSNILLMPQGGVFLTDFGLAKIAQSGESTLSQDMMLGTPHYISPEQAQGQPDLDARTDIYSLGVVMYELFVGRVPFQADTPYAVIHDHIYAPLPLPRCLNPDLPEPFERVLLKSLAKERDDRYTTVNDLLAALEKAAVEATTAPVEVKPPCEEGPAPQAMAQTQVSQPPAPAETMVAPPTVHVAPAAPAAAAATAVLAASASPATSALSAPPAAQAKKKSFNKWWLVVGGAGLLVLCILGAWFVINLRGRASLQTARKLRDEGRFDQAIAEYLAAAKANSRLVQAYIEPAEMLMNRGQPGDFLRAAQVCERGLSVMPEDLELRVCAARAWLATNDLGNAAPHLQWLIEHQPRDALPHAGMALVLMQRGQLDAAQDQAQQAIKLNPDAPEGHFALGMVLLKTGHPAEARDQFRFVVNSPAAPRWMKDQLPK